MTGQRPPNGNLEDRLHAWMSQQRPDERLAAAHSLEEGLRRSAGVSRRSRGRAAGLLRALTLVGAAVAAVMLVIVGMEALGPLRPAPPGADTPTLVPASDLTRRSADVPPGDVISVANIGQELWLLTEAGELIAADIESGERLAAIPFDYNGCGILEAGASHLWFRACPTGPGLVRTEIVQVDARDRSIVARVRFETVVGTSLAATTEGVWVVQDPEEGLLAFISATSGAVERRVRIGEEVGDVAVVDGRVWVGLPDGNAVGRVDLEGQQVDSRVSLPSAPGVLVHDGSSLWVGARDAPELWRIQLRGATFESTLKLPATSPAHQLLVDGPRLWLLTGQDLLVLDMPDRLTHWIYVGAHSVLLPPQFEGPTAALGLAPDGVWFVHPFNEMVLISTVP